MPKREKNERLKIKIMTKTTADFTKAGYERKPDTELTHLYIKIMLIS